MKPLNLIYPFFNSRYAAKIAIASILSFGLFSTNVNAQNDRRGQQGHDQKPAPTRHFEERQHSNSQTRTVQPRPVTTMPPQRTFPRTNTTPRPNQPNSLPRTDRPNTTTRSNQPNTNTRPNRTNNVYNSTTVNNRTNNVYRGSSDYRRPIYDAHNPSWRYSRMPMRNTVVMVIPVGYRTVNYGGYAYRYNRGIFYRPYNNSFMIVAPPIGIFIDIMPIGYRRLYVNDYPYYYYNGSYYDYRNTHYYVVSPPVGAVVESLPVGYQTVVIDGETYYTIDGAQYKPVVQDNGEVWYQVIKAN